MDSIYTNNIGRQVRKIREWDHYSHHSIFLIFGMVVFYLNLDEYENLWTLMPLLVLSFVSFVYEFLHLIVDLNGYIKDPWNWLDIFRDVPMIIYAICQYAIPDLDLGSLLITVVASSWAKGLSFFRVNGSTRYIVFLYQSDYKIDFVFYFASILNIAFAATFFAVGKYENEYQNPISSYFL